MTRTYLHALGTANAAAADGRAVALRLGLLGEEAVEHGPRLLRVPRHGGGQCSDKQRGGKEGGEGDKGGKWGGEGVEAGGWRGEESQKDDGLGAEPSRAKPVVKEEAKPHRSK